MPAGIDAQTVTTVIVAGLTGGGLVSFIDAVRNRGKDKAAATATVSQAAANLVEMLQSTANEAQLDAAEARKAAKEARIEADATLRQMHIVRQEMEIMAYRFRRLTGAILDDNMTREDLKLMVRAPSPGGTG